MNRTALMEASAELQAAWNKIQEIADANPSLMIYQHERNPETGKDQASYGESFGSFVEMADARIVFIRKQLNKYADKLPKGKRRKSSKQS
jgi:hypothetical protein